jgi:hypothetical protein
VIIREWLDSVKVVYFGPSKQLMYDDSELVNAAIEVANLGESFACKAISDR